MKRTILAASCAAAALAASAQAQSLTDAINAALAPGAAGNCQALGGATPRFQDTYFFNAGPNDVSITNGETGSLPNVPAPLTVDDGLGRTFIINQSNFMPFDPAFAAALTEDELLELFRSNGGVGTLTIDRFQAGALGAGLSGLCQSVSVFSGNNNNTSTAGGFAGGSSSASGRSISSLSSAREQSSKAKKRKRKKDDRNSSYEDGYIRLASAEGGVGMVADAAGVGPFGVQTFIDLRGGYTDIDRDATALEGGFEGHSVFGQGSITAQFVENLALAGSFAYQRSKGEFDQANASGEANEFSESNYTGSAFLIASFPLAGVASFDFAAGGFYGSGDGEIERTFATTRLTTYTVVVTNPNPPPNQVDLPLSFMTQVSDDLTGEYDTRNYGFSVAASVSFPAGGFIVTPGVEFTHFTFKQDAYDESVADSFNNGLALSYSNFRDKWTETRIGGALSRDFGLLRLEGYGDLVLTGGAETPTRTATFAEDLRANPYVLSYRVDNLDKTYGVFGLVAAAGIGEGVEAFVGGEANAGHDYLRARTIFAGIRFTP